MIPIKYASTALMITQGLKSALFCLPIVMLYCGYKGVGIGDFFLLQGLSWLFVFVLEIPTGYIGDVFSRKIIIMLGLFGWIAGHLFWIFGYGFWWILAGELMFAVAIALVSGTIEAYLYDLLKRRHKEHLFHRKFSKMKTIENICLFLSTLVGSLLYQLQPELPIWASVACLVISIGILLFLPDVPESRRQVKPQTSKMQDILSITRFAVKHAHIKWLILFPSVYGMLTLIFMWGLQSVMITRELPIFIFSFIFAANSLARTGWSAVSGKLLEKYGLNKLILLSGVIIMIGVVGACSAIYVPYMAVYACLACMIIAGSSCSLTSIITSTLIHHRIASDERSTVLSVNSMFSRAFGGIGMIALKPLFDNLGVGETFMISSLLIILIFFCSMKLYRLRLDMMEKQSA